MSDRPPHSAAQGTAEESWARAGAGRSRWSRTMQTLKFRVVLVAVVSALLSGLASTLFVSHQSGRVATELLLRQQAGEVALLADGLNDKVRQAQDILRFLASQTTPELLASPEALQALLLSRPLTRSTFVSLYVADPQGVVLASAVQSKTLGVASDVAGLPEFRSTVATGLPVIADPVADPSKGRASVTFTMPVRLADETLLAVVVGVRQFDPQTLLPSMPVAVTNPDSRLIAHSRSGLILAHPNGARLLQNVNTEPGLEPSPEAGYIVARAIADLPQWTVARVTTTQAALGALQAVQQHSLLVTAAIMLLCALTAAVLILRMTRPISALSDRARQLLRNDMPASEGWPQAQGEIGDLVAVFRQVTMAREKAQMAQGVLLDQMKAILKNASVGILFTRDGQFELAGHKICELLGYEEHELYGQLVRMIYPSDEAYAELGGRARKQFAERGYFDDELVFKRKDGSTFWAHMLGRGVIPDDPSGGTIWIVEDITQARAAREQLSWAATHDNLTQLANRHEFEVRLVQAMQHLEGRDIGVMFIDLDHFKAINDAAGHAAGDEALRQIARLLEDHVRQSDTVGRMGGDEFAVLLPGCSLARAQEIAEQIRDGVAHWYLNHEGQSFSVGASIGVVHVANDLPDVAAVLNAADSACYAAKRAGKNRVETFVRDGGAVDRVAETAG